MFGENKQVENLVKWQEVTHQINRIYCVFTRFF